MYHRQDAEKAAAAFREQATDQCCNAAREQTVGELLDHRIFEVTRVADALRDLKASLPGSYLNSGASRVAPLMAKRD